MIEIAKTHQFTEDWFSRNIAAWKGAVIPALPGREHFLEIGCFEGRASCWMLENMMSDTASLHCIDTFEGSPEFALLPKEHTENVEARFQANIACSKKPDQRVRMMKMTSDKALGCLLSQDFRDYFDFIYIDAGHLLNETLTDAVMAWPLLKNGGVMVFDDYLWNLHNDVQSRPKFAVDLFVALWNPYLVTLGVGEQYIVKKVIKEYV